MDLDLVSCSGNKLTKRDGTVVLDFLSQYGALPFGHNPEFAVQAVNQYLSDQKPVFCQPVMLDISKRLAERLIGAMGGAYQHCVFTNSGAEAVEAAIKLARMRTGRKKILSVHNSFHGKTSAALACTGSSRYSVSVLDTPDFDQIALNNRDTLNDALCSKEFAAFIVEPVLGEGGMVCADKVWLQRARELCKETGTLLIFDEIQTGLGRVGAISMSIKLGIDPDILLLAKALGAGVLPSGAILYNDRASCREFERKHSSTFAGNGLAAAAGLALLDHLEAGQGQIFQHVENIARIIDQHCFRLKEQFCDMFNFSGGGLMRAVTINDIHNTENYTVNYLQNTGYMGWIICSWLLNRHSLLVAPLLSSPGAIRIEPNLNVSEEDINTLFIGIEQVCEIIAKGRYDLLLADLVGVDVETLPKVNSGRPDWKVKTQLTAGSERVKGKTFAFLIHTTMEKDVIANFPSVVKENFPERGVRRLAQLLIKLGRIAPNPHIALKFTVHGALASAQGILISSPITAEDMMKLPASEKKKLLEDWLHVARQEGAEVIGLGGYSSVISKGGLTVKDQLKDITLTSGNSLTACSTSEAILQAEDYDMRGKSVLIIGARGSVGKLITAQLSMYCDDLILVGRQGNGERLRRDLLQYLCRQVLLCSSENALEGSVYQRLDAYITHPDIQKLINNIDDPSLLLPCQLITERIMAAEYEQKLGLTFFAGDFSAIREIPKIDYVVSATSAGKAIIKANVFGSGTTIVDVSRPFDFDISESGPRVIEGGLVHQPSSQSYGDSNVTGTPAGINLACLSETIALALNSSEGHYSIGKCIDYKEAQAVMEIALKHGFTPVHFSHARQNCA
ncbi:aminotransferase class III-fold pyridoxal phosphate-dependent enzyme [Parendozoicomonas haliclonae]|nr:aminotransferase class III-fold pyridoxal phosphate-dependent enzyme [Parendozoicomonas haliclonae]